MKCEEFKYIQDVIGMNREQMADLLHCSVSTIAAYRSESKSRRRNMPAIVKKVLLDEFIKRGGDPQNLVQFQEAKREMV